ncbi:MAG: PAC2 family protein [Candidatus Bathyarchaeota archaeon]|nr:PAC2 family protein [Candidatus Bathyarchaeota archaeon]
MKETYVKERLSVALREPVLVAGLPGLGLVGKIAVRYLVKRLGAQRFGFLYSPHFPYFVLVNKRGGVRLLRGVFYFWRNPVVGGRDFIFFTGDSQSQTIEGQYEIADCMLDFARRHGVVAIVTIGGYRVEAQGKPKVYVAATGQGVLEKALGAGAVVSDSGSPIVGTAGLILGLARFKRMDALCLLGETRGYLPDPLAARSVLEVLNGAFGLGVDLAGLDEDIARAERMVSRLQKIEEQRVLQAEESRKQDVKKTTYIS